MGQYKKIRRKVEVVLRGIVCFKDWPMWLGWRLGLLKRDSRERLFRIRNGMVFYFNAVSCSGAGYFQELFLNNEYFKEYIPKDNDIVLDIGGHIGIFSVQMARMARNIKIFAYEPSPALYSLFSKNIQANNLREAVSIVNAAVAPQNGTIRFYTSDAGLTGITALDVFQATDPEGKQLHVSKNFIDVPAVTLSDIFLKHNITTCNFMKMDCEGEEFDIILNSSRETLRKIDAMCIEYHDKPQYIIDYLRSCGFRVTEGPALSNNCGMLYVKRVSNIHSDRIR